MGFLSYAQNFEDVMLYRALKHVERGTYVDVGAQHPVIDSVSKAFHELGWKGVHFEPVPEFAELVRQDRPGDLVLQVALADTEGTLELNVFPDTGLSTAVGAYADKHKAERGYGTRRIQVPVRTLASALTSLQGTEVHWLKIDVEGFEEQVLRGWDSTTLRPWIMVVEATIPNSPETDYQSWDPILVAAGYQFVYFDGLNRFYVAHEHPELIPAFACPPNVFDAAELSGLSSWGLCRKVLADAAATEHALHQRAAAVEAQLSERAAALQSQLARQRHAAEETEARLHAHIAWQQSEWEAARLEADAAQHALQRIVTSKSWRMTAPMRWLLTKMKWGAALPRRTVGWALRRTGLRRAPAPLAPVPQPQRSVAHPHEPSLTPRAARVYADLANGIEPGND